MRQFRVLLALPLFLASACAGDLAYQDVYERSGFSPLVPRQGVEEYQIIWSRPWKPIIYIQAKVQAGHDGGNEGVFVRIARTQRGSPRFRQYQLSRADWRNVEEAIVESGFWTRELPCQEASYREQTLHVEVEGDGTRIAMLDGATLSMAASKAPRARGLTAVCPDLDQCPPFDVVIRAFFLAIGESFEGM